MNVMFQVGSEYNKYIFHLPVKDAVAVLSILRRNGISYDGEGWYKYTDIKLAIIEEEYKVRPKPIAITMPPQVEDAINDI